MPHVASLPQRGFWQQQSHPRLDSCALFPGLSWPMKQPQMKTLEFTVLEGLAGGLHVCSQAMGWSKESFGRAWRADGQYQEAAGFSAVGGASC